MARKKLGELLIEAGLIDQAGLRAGLAEQSRFGGPLGRILIEMRLVSEPQLVAALSRQMAVPTVELENFQPGPEILALVPADMAVEQTVVPFAREGKFLDVATADPTNSGVIDQIRMRAQLNVRVHLAGPKAIERALARWYRRGPGMLNASMQREGAITAPVEPIDLKNESRDALDIQLGRFGEPAAAGRAAPPLNALAAGPSVVFAAPPPSDGSLNQVQVTSPVPAQPLTMTAPIGNPVTLPPVAQPSADVRALQTRLAKLEAMVQRDEDVLRRLMGLLVAKGVATREEIMEYLK